MSNTEYNGWANKSTWLLKLWLDNDEGTQKLMRHCARGMSKHGLISFLEEWVEETREEYPESPMLVDLANSGFDWIDYREVAESLINEHCEESSYDCPDCEQPIPDSEEDKCPSCGEGFLRPESEEQS